MFKHRIVCNEDVGRTASELFTRIYLVLKRRAVETILKIFRIFQLPGFPGKESKTDRWVVFEKLGHTINLIIHKRVHRVDNHSSDTRAFDRPILYFAH